MADPAPTAGRPARAARAVLGPLVGYFDRRFDDVHQRLASLERSVAELRDEVARLRASSELDAETTIELHHSLEQAVRELGGLARDQGSQA